MSTIKTNILSFKTQARTCLISIFLLLFSLNMYAQNNYFFGHYMFNPTYFNPSWVGQEAFVNAIHRSQWVGYNTTLDGVGGAPSSQQLSLSIPMSVGISGIGLIISNDKVATLYSNQVKIPISINKEFAFGEILFGIMPSIFIQGIRPNYRPRDEGDLLIPQDRSTEVKPNLDAGITFKKNNFFVGVAFENILQPTFSFNVAAQNKIKMGMNFFGGVSFYPNKFLKISPTLLIRSDFISYTFDISTLITYKDGIWGGLTYRRSESLNFLLGYSFLKEEKLKIGYALDVVLRDVKTKTPTSHEIMITYMLPRLSFEKKQIVKTPRFSN